MSFDRSKMMASCPQIGHHDGSQTAEVERGDRVGHRVTDSVLFQRTNSATCASKLPRIRALIWRR